MDKIFESILIVEDEPNLANAIEIAMKKLGIPSVRRVSTLEEARRKIRESAPQFILLDRNLPDGDGLSLCADMRRDDFAGAILMLTAAGQTEDRVLGLNSGADDYLAKPFSWDELGARIRALSRRNYHFIKIWDIDENRLRINGARGWVELTPLEFKLAHHLMSAQGAIVSRDELLKDVWGFTLLPKTRTVDHFLGRLRKHFEVDPEQPRHFITVRGAGYRFQA